MSLKSGLFILALFLSGCATAAKYEDNLNRFIGKSQQEVLAAWGEPTRQYLLGEKKVFEYITRYTPQGPGYANPAIVNVYRPQNTEPKAAAISTRHVSPEPDLKLYCKTIFLLDANNMVSLWRHEGNDCVSR